MFKKHGNENITAISIVRTPLSNILYQILNTITFSELDKRLQSDSYSYDKLYHLKLIINHKYSIEKENTIKFNHNDFIPPDSEVIHLKSYEIPVNLSILKFCENCKLQMGHNMFSYNAKIIIVKFLFIIY
jgi:hypothetical protein